jgi:hypothetical protein
VMMAISPRTGRLSRRPRPSHQRQPPPTAKPQFLTGAGRWRRFSTAAITAASESASPDERRRSTAASISSGSPGEWRGGEIPPRHSPGDPDTLGLARTLRTTIQHLVSFKECRPENFDFRPDRLISVLVSTNPVPRGLLVSVNPVLKSR